MAELQAKREKKIWRRRRLKRLKIACLVRYGTFYGSELYRTIRRLANEARLTKEARQREMRMRGNQWKAPTSTV